MVNPFKGISRSLICGICSVHIKCSYMFIIMCLDMYIPFLQYVRLCIQIYIIYVKMVQSW